MTDALLGKATPTLEPNDNDSEMKGWLLKWTNYLKGYQKRWFVLSKGVLSYYRNQAEMNHTCRGTISLHGALIHTVDSCTFVVSNGGTQTFHIKTASEVERQSWVTALELAKVKAIRAMESEEEEEKETLHVVPSIEITNVVRELTDRLESLRTCYDLITKHGIALQSALSDLKSANIVPGDDEAIAGRIKLVNERATLFRITSKAMINACNDYLRSAESQGHKWSKALQHERENRQRLEEIVEQLAKQHTQLEQAAHLVQRDKAGGNALYVGSQSIELDMGGSMLVSDDDTEFFDAEDDKMCFPCPAENNALIVKVHDVKEHITQTQTSSSSTSSFSSEKEYNLLKYSSSVCVLENTKYMNESQPHSAIKVHNNREANEKQNNFGNSDNASKPLDDAGKDARDSASGNSGDPNKPGGSALTLSSSSKITRKRRTRVPDKPNYPLNLWSIMKNCIGKELSKIPMPINFNEPLSMLQRLTEDYEYAELLDQAAKCDDECEQLAYIAAFTVSSYSTTSTRTGKPFNPLLGETFECDRTEDLGWRCIAEQVSHHPPMAAIHCEGHEWTCWQEFTMTSKFRGKYLQIIPLGNAFVIFPKTNRKYIWRKVTTTVNNIIVGKLWVDQHGDMEIRGLNAASGTKCILKYIPYSYFSRETQRRVNGYIMDRNNEVKWVLRGTWDNKIEVAEAYSVSGPPDSPVYQTGNYKTIWERRMPAEDSEKYYNFTVLASQLNEMEEGVAPTDSRHRPDQRYMEEGNWDESNREKVRLEEKQRASRKRREIEAEAAARSGEPFPPYQPLWFAQQREPDTDSIIHIYNGKYWEHKLKQDWLLCPDIF